MLNEPVTALKGIGNTRAKLFEKVGVETVGDLLSYFPRGHEDRTKIVPIFEANEGETVCIHATVFSAVSERRINNSFSLYTAELIDASGVMQATWFNNKYISRSIIKGETYTFYGKIKRIGKNKCIENPIFEKNSSENIVTGKIIPLYPLTAGLTQKNIQTAMNEAIRYAGEMQETLPLQLREKYSLIPLDKAVRDIHFPSDFASYDAARRRLVFDELFTFVMALSKIRVSRVSHTRFTDINTKYTYDFIKRLPFTLTNAQKKVIEDICGDFSGGTAMNRLVQGDVGSGKTVVAAAAMYAAAKSGYQAALMAPTEVLARQHYENFIKIMDGAGIRICLLTGSTSKREKDEIYNAAANGDTDIIIGTHAIIQENVKYKNLSLVVTDEQHRFGVIHRSAIAEKGDNPHIIVMSATPIPRTLALVVYGDLDISVIDELPPGRKPVETYCVGENMRPRVFNFIKKHVLEGRQAYVVCPLIEDSDAVNNTAGNTQRSSSDDLKNVIDYAKMLSNKIFPEFRCALIHGRLKNDEKDEIMHRFKNGEIDILIATTVIEVGIDVGNANIMVIENAERFGLSQLHQLRGRVGRGSEQSYCILFNQSDSKLSKKRMKIMCSSNDGFYIADEDLKLRGPGDFFGTKQHGLPQMHIANLFCDTDILLQVRSAASDIVGGVLAFTEDERRNLDKSVSRLSDKILL